MKKEDMISALDAILTHAKYMDSDELANSLEILLRDISRLRT